MRNLGRRLALWGGAAAIAGGGFSFTASNTVDSASVGAGTAPATGYTVTTVTWKSAKGPTGDTFWVTGVTLVLTSKAATAPADAIPTSVNVALQLTTGNDLPITTGAHGSCRFGTTGHAWALEGTGRGTGQLICSVEVSASGEPPVTHIAGLAVEASN